MIKVLLQMDLVEDLKKRIANISLVQKDLQEKEKDLQEKVNKLKEGLNKLSEETNGVKANLLTDEKKLSDLWNSNNKHKESLKNLQTELYFIENRNLLKKVKITYKITGKTHDGYCSGADSDDYEENINDSLEIVTWIPKDGTLPEMDYRINGCNTHGSGYCRGFYEMYTFQNIEDVDDSVKLKGLNYLPNTWPFEVYYE
jgi:hypothetical protein